MRVGWFELGAECRNGALWDGEKCQMTLGPALRPDLTWNRKSIINNTMQY